MRKITLSVITILILLLILLAAGCIGVIKKAPSASFEELNRNKTFFYESQYALMDTYLFQNGTVVYYNSTNRTQVAIVASTPLNKEELTNGDYIAVRVYSPLNIGDNVDVRGIIQKAKYNETEIYYLSAKDMIVTGKTNTSNPDFQSILRTIAAKEQDNSDDLFLANNMVLSGYMNPANPFSPFRLLIK